MQTFTAEEEQKQKEEERKNLLREEARKYFSSVYPEFKEEIKQAEIKLPKEDSDFYCNNSKSFMILKTQEHGKIIFKRKHNNVYDPLANNLDDISAEDLDNFIAENLTLNLLVDPIAPTSPEYPFETAEIPLNENLDEKLQNMIRRTEPALNNEYTTTYIHDLCRKDIVVQKYIEKDTLKKLNSINPPEFNIGKRLEVLEGLVQSNIFWEENNIIHTDYSNKNIVITENWKPFLVDIETSLKLKNSGAKINESIITRPYGAPELYEGKVNKKIMRFYLGQMILTLFCPEAVEEYSNDEELILLTPRKDYLIRPTLFDEEEVYKINGNHVNIKFSDTLKEMIDCTMKDNPKDRLSPADAMVYINKLKKIYNNQPKSLKVA